MEPATLITAAAHLMQNALWALAFLLCGQVADFEKAFYLSAQNYTTLCYGDMLLAERWRLLGPLEAMTGLLFFGLSTAVLFAVLSHLIAIRLRGHVGDPSEAAANPVLGVSDMADMAAIGPRPGQFRPVAPAGDPMTVSEKGIHPTGTFVAPMA
jgi:hypothetical protein